MTGTISGKLLRRSLAVSRERGEIDWGVSEETYQFWKASAGNAKSRRRWRRRDIPNSQRPAVGQEQWARTRCVPGVRAP